MSRRPWAIARTSQLRSLSPGWRLPGQLLNGATPATFQLPTFFGQAEAEMDVGQPRHAAPEDHVAWRWVYPAVEISAESGEPSQEAANSFPACTIRQRDEMFKKRDLALGSLHRRFGALGGHVPGSVPCPQIVLRVNWPFRETHSKMHPEGFEPPTLGSEGLLMAATGIFEVAAEAVVLRRVVERMRSDDWSPDFPDFTDFRRLCYQFSDTNRTTIQASASLSWSLAFMWTERSYSAAM